MHKKLERTQLSLDLEQCARNIAADVPHPIPYQGSKRALAKHIVRYLPHGTSTLIEPFAGSAAVSLAAVRCKAAKRFRLSDINAPLMQLWKAIVETPDCLAAEYEQLWNAQIGQERSFYDAVRTRFNQKHCPSDLLYLLARCVKASVLYNTKGEFNQSPDNRRKGTAPSTMRANIVEAARLLAGKTEAFAQDYRDAVRLATIEDVIYMDPPYQGVSGNRDARYVRGLSAEEFVKTLNELNAREVSYIVSYDGRTGSKSFGQKLPANLNLVHLELSAGRSSQATLLGRADQTVESLYLSPVLVERLGKNSTEGYLTSSHGSVQLSS